MDCLLRAVRDLCACRCTDSRTAGVTVRALTRCTRVGIPFNDVRRPKRRPAYLGPGDDDHGFRLRFWHRIAGADCIAARGGRCQSRRSRWLLWNLAGHPWAHSTCPVGLPGPGWTCRVVVFLVIPHASELRGVEHSRLDSAIGQPIPTLQSSVSAVGPTHVRPIGNDFGIVNDGG